MRGAVMYGSGVCSSHPCVFARGSNNGRPLLCALLSCSKRYLLLLHTGLQSVDLNGLGASVSASVLSAVARLPDLTRLLLADCKKIPNDGLRQVFASSGATQLREVDLSGCIKLAADSVAVLARSATRLQRLSLKGCGKVTDRATAAISTSCPELLELDLSDCECNSW